MFQDVDNPDLYHTHAASMRGNLGHLVGPDEIITLDEARARAAGGHLVIVNYQAVVAGRRPVKFESEV